MILACVDQAMQAQPTSAGLIGLTVGLGALALAVYGAGFTAFVRMARYRPRPVVRHRRNGSCCLKCWLLG